MKRQLITACLVLSGISGAYAQALQLANTTPLPIAQLAPDTQLNNGQWQLVAGDVDAMILGEIDGLLSSQVWSDQQVAQYVQRFGEKPLRLLLAAKPEQNEPTPTEQAELFSGRAGQPLLYLYLNRGQTGQLGIELGARLAGLDKQRWQQQGWLAAPAVISQTNLVTLGINSAKFEGGYR
ncbi:hypothetical protein [Motilimonas eburnea]|uniref:hypothetical protein n=1 Tax=Motilimonas eburnea TaxID=1737488 RepID=UPI001E4CEC21|nr:hypothetical protein [Motilimonas eburnea]MCE2570730.1 hypothetical protein [Motilimonas eburnea]